MPLSSRDDLELLRLAVDGLGGRTYRPGGGNRAVAGRVDGTPGFMRFYDFQPVTVMGAEAQNAIPSFHDDGPSLPVYPLNGVAPGSGLYTVARAVNWRWASKGYPRGCELLVTVWACCYRKLPGADVRVVRGAYDQTQTTDADGQTTFDLSAPGPGTYAVTVTKGPYTETRSVTVTCAGDFAIFGVTDWPDTLTLVDGCGSLAMTKHLVTLPGFSYLAWFGCRMVTDSGYDVLDPYYSTFSCSPPPIRSIDFPLTYTLACEYVSRQPTGRIKLDISWPAGPVPWADAYCRPGGPDSLPRNGCKAPNRFTSTAATCDDSTIDCFGGTNAHPWGQPAISGVDVTGYDDHGDDPCSPPNFLFDMAGVPAGCGGATMVTA